MAMNVYLDNSASTRLLPSVLDAMLPYFHEHYGNASSLHSAGREAREAIDRARATIAAALGAAPQEIVFTSGGTESNNMAIKGVAFANKDRGRHIIVSAIEHDCVLNSCRWLTGQGFRVSLLPVDESGLVDVWQLAEAIQHDTILVSVMHANNEIGTIEPIEEIGELCRRRGVYFHSDACQSFTRLPIDVSRQAVDLLTINAHKIHGPKGVGALYIREGTRITAWQHGGGHEGGMRSSTENVPGIVGFAAAAKLCSDEADSQMPRLAALRDRIIERVLGSVGGAYLNGHRTRRLPTNVNLGFHGLEGDAIRLLLELDAAGIAVSTGSACSANESENKPSHVLRAIGRNAVEARGAVRVSLGLDNTEEEVEYFLETLTRTVEDLRSISSARLGGH
ncbi:MAG TPA: cysteine desulfurase family protein [Phycisphaerae bacterium]|nr:cysteine desulfurase family protein [Phycisphaerae bacterium]